MQRAVLALATLTAALTMTLTGGAAHAQGKPLPPPASDAMPPVELDVSLKDGRAACSPAELRLPGDTNVELHVVSTAARAVTLTIQGQFENGRVLHTDGDVVHVASEKGYTIKQNGKGMIRFRSLPAGEVPFACTSTGDQSEPFTGKVILSKAAG